MTTADPVSFICGLVIGITLSPCRWRRGSNPPPAPCDLTTLLTPGYEPGDGSAHGAQMVDQAWWHPAMGCDSLAIVVDNARDALAQQAEHLAPTKPQPPGGRLIRVDQCPPGPSEP